MELHIVCQPGAAKTEIVGMYRDELKIRLAARPVEGKGNLELCKSLAQYFRVSHQAVQLLSGKAFRQKPVLIKKKTAREIQECLGSLCI